MKNCSVDKNGWVGLRLACALSKVATSITRLDALFGFVFCLVLYLTLYYACALMCLVYISHTLCRASLFWQHLSCITARNVVGFPVLSPSWLAVVLRCVLVFLHPGWLLVCLAVGCCLAYCLAWRLDGGACAVVRLACHLSLALRQAFLGEPQRISSLS